MGPELLCRLQREAYDWDLLSGRADHAATVAELVKDSSCIKGGGQIRLQRESLNLLWSLTETGARFIVRIMFGSSCSFLRLHIPNFVKVPRP